MAVDRSARASDVIVRTASAAVMVAVTGSALFLGGLWWAAFVLLVAFGVWFEWSVLVMLFQPPGAARLTWRIAGAAYCAIAALALIYLRAVSPQDYIGIQFVVTAILPVIATDVGAYFTGRTIGGPKIAPRISPSKTWAGLLGGMVAAVLVALAWLYAITDYPMTAYQTTFAIVMGALIAVVAQAGDFFESWMKRRAGVKDSGNLLPGHGGLFDRLDGLIAVLFLLGLFFMLSGPRAIL